MGKKYKTNLQAMRKRAGFKSANAFAEYFGIPKDTYTKYEQGTSNMTLLLAWEFADALNCSLDELAGRKTPDTQLAPDEEELIGLYRDCDARGKNAIMRNAVGEAGVEGQSHGDLDEKSA